MGRAFRRLTVIGITSAALAVASTSPGAAQPRRASFQGDNRFLVLEALDDDLIHFEYGAGGTVPAGAIATSLMVAKTDYRGPRSYSSSARGLETAEVSVNVVAGTLCFTVTEKSRRAPLTTICPSQAQGGEQVLTLARSGMQNVYGLGEQFLAPGMSDGDWVGKERSPGNEFGNRMVGYQGGAVGNALFPIMYAVGEGGVSYAFFLDNTYRQHWDFRADPWRVRMRGGPLRGYVLSGRDLPDLRRDYLELTGAPPVPPRKAFGLWVSEFGYDHWYELETKLETLRRNRFPVDGFVLDLQWFGGIITGSDLSPMGSLTWDLKKFPHPRTYIARLRTQHGLGVIPIEEPYIARGLAEHDTLERRGFLVRQRENGPPVYLTENPWWGKGSMMDFTNGAGAAFWHDWRRQPLVEIGVTGHWTDLGEPELFDSAGWYHGVVPGRHAHADVHNVYNLAWSRSVFEGYRRHRVQRRPLILSRSGTSGSQRYGVSMWSGDIGSNFESLATHFNAQMHMSMSGMDYFGSDVGGFHRGALQGDSLNQLYTQWLAAAAMLEVPVRAHTENLCNCKETAPDRIGHVPSNLANLQLRYSLTPYYYSLAHRARLAAEPVTPPLAYYYQTDPAVRTMGHEKLVGRDLLVAIVARYGERQRDVYLPAGTWYDFHTNAMHQGGTWLRNVPVYRDSVFRLPLYARAGAIIPRMHVDEQTMNVMGRRLDGSVRHELIARVYPDARESRFVLYEDDGETIAYLSGALAQTTIAQRSEGGSTLVTIGARQGTYAGAPARRANVVELVVGQSPVRSVLLNGGALARRANLQELERAGSGWVDAGNGLVVARSAEMPASTAKRFEFRS